MHVLLDFLPSDETIDGMVHSKGISDGGLGIVLWVNVFNVVDDGIQQMRLSHSTSRDHCGHVGDVDMEVIYEFGTPKILAQRCHITCISKGQVAYGIEGLQ